MGDLNIVIYSHKIMVLKLFHDIEMPFPSTIYIKA